MTYSQNDQNEYIYAITRRDLSFPQQAVQACHASMEAFHQYKDPQAEHPHLVLCAVRDERRLALTARKLKSQGIRIIEWREPDRNNELTAIATEPLSGARRRCAKDFQLIQDPAQGVLT